MTSNIFLKKVSWCDIHCFLSRAKRVTFILKKITMTHNSTISQAYLTFLTCHY